jgi:hypothetical protein
VWCASGQNGCQAFWERSIVFREFIFFIGAEIEIFHGVFSDQPQQHSDQGTKKPFEQCEHGKLHPSKLFYDGYMTILA